MTIAILRHALAMIFIFGTTLRAPGTPMEELSRRELGPLLVFTAAYLLLVLTVKASTRNGKQLGVHNAVFAGLIVYLAASLALAIFGFNPPQAVVTTGVVSILGMFLLDLMGNRRRGAALFVVTASVAALLALGFGKDIELLHDLALKKQIVDRRNISTALYRVTLSQFRNVVTTLKFSTRAGVEEEMRRGGALATFGERYLLATGDGRMYVFDWNRQSEQLDLRELGLRIPINNEEFIAATDADVDRRTFRVADVLTRETAGKMRIYASYHVWNTGAQCSTMRVSWAESTIGHFTEPHPAIEWHDIFETTPCLPLKNRATRFGGLQNGGRMALLDDDTLLLTIGDHQFDGYYSTQMLPQETGNSYGKIFRIKLAENSAELVSLGHRNPEGLYIDPHGVIWSTEHGPKGGDELNRIVANGNYGWPLVTFGTAYDKTSWPLSKTPGRHDGFIAPVYSWIPSIGVSDLLGIEGAAFELWRDDLMVASLTGRSLWRLRLIDQHVVYSEEIPLNCRIRDILAAHDGELLAWCDDARTIIALVPASADSDGEALFAQCEGCHSITEDRAHGIGPDLRGVNGRKIASVAGFEYSKALRDINGRRWSSAALDEFLKSPQAYAPGTAMEFAGIANDRQRAALVEYLQGIRK